MFRRVLDRVEQFGWKKAAAIGTIAGLVGYGAYRVASNPLVQQVWKLARQGLPSDPESAARRGAATVESLEIAAKGVLRETRASTVRLLSVTSARSEVARLRALAAELKQAGDKPAELARVSADVREGYRRLTILHAARVLVLTVTTGFVHAVSRLQAAVAQRRALAYQKSMEPALLAQLMRNFKRALVDKQSVRLASVVESALEKRFPKGQRSVEALSEDAFCASVEVVLRDVLQKLLSSASQSSGASVSGRRAEAPWLELFRDLDFNSDPDMQSLLIELEAVISCPSWAQVSAASVLAVWQRSVLPLLREQVKAQKRPQVMFLQSSPWYLRVFEQLWPDQSGQGSPALATLQEFSEPSLDALSEVIVQLGSPDGSLVGRSSTVVGSASSEFADF